MPDVRTGCDLQDRWAWTAVADLLRLPRQLQQQCPFTDLLESCFVTAVLAKPQFAHFLQSCSSFADWDGTRFTF